MSNIIRSLRVSFKTNCRRTYDSNDINGDLSTLNTIKVDLWSNSGLTRQYLKINAAPLIKTNENTKKKAISSINCSGLIQVSDQIYFVYKNKWSLLGLEKTDEYSSSADPN